MPSRNLNAAIDFFARVITGRLARDLSQLLGSGIQKLDVLGRLAKPNVEDDLLEAGYRHNVVDPELVLELGHDFVLIPDSQPGWLAILRGSLLAGSRFCVSLLGHFLRSSSFS